MTGETLTVAEFQTLLDRWGADMNLWRDQEAAVAARRLVLASSDHRRIWEGARRLDAGASQHFANMACAPETTAAVERVAARVSAQIGGTGVAISREAGFLRAAGGASAQGAAIRVWAPGLAAGFVLFMLLGGLFDRIVRQPDAAVEYTVRVESLVFGPSESDLL